MLREKNTAAPAWWPAAPGFFWYNNVEIMYWESKRMGFPRDFQFGFASSAAQVEGGGFEDGRGASIWDTFMDRMGEGVLKPSVACDSYRRFDTDLANLRAIGVNSYRLSIAWPRVLPEGVGSLNQKGMDYYRMVFEKLLGAGISPNVTLYHWDLPQALEDRGGWRNRDSAEWFRDYAEKMFRAFGDIVPTWVTINEPIAVFVGYGLGAFAPGYKNKAWGNQARHNVLTAHGAGVEAFRASGAKGKIGVVIDIWKRIPATDDPADAALALDEDEENWKFYCDRVFRGRHSDYILKKFESEGTLMEMRDEDFRLGALPLDFYGLNYYNTVTVSARKETAVNAGNGGNFADDFNHHPEAIADVVKMLVGMYDLRLPICVTENGYCPKHGERPAADGVIHDDDRIAYLSAVLSGLERLIGEGYPITGYRVWSMMDDYEWSAGDKLKYGLMHTDFKTFERTWKKSACWYRDFIAGARE